MKKSAVLIGILAPLYFHLVFNLNLHIPYVEEYNTLFNIAFILFPIIPGIVIAFMLVRKTFKEFLKAFVVCLVLSVCVEVLYSIADIDMIIFRKLTGYDEIYYGEALTFIFTYFYYTISCFFGYIIAGVTSLFKQLNNNAEKKELLKDESLEDEGKEVL